MEKQTKERRVGKESDGRTDGRLHLPLHAWLSHAPLVRSSESPKWGNNGEKESRRVPKLLGRPVRPHRAYDHGHHHGRPSCISRRLVSASHPTGGGGRAFLRSPHRLFHMKISISLSVPPRLSLCRTIFGGGRRRRRKCAGGGTRAAGVRRPISPLLSFVQNGGVIEHTDTQGSGARPTRFLLPPPSLHHFWPSDFVRRESGELAHSLSQSRHRRHL